MSFPTTPVLDDFDRGDSATTIGGDWAMFMRSAGSYDMGISSKEAYNPDSEYNGLIYDAAQYGPACEVYAFLGTLPDLDSNGFKLYARQRDVVVDAWNFDGYRMLSYPYVDGGTKINLSLARVDDNVETQLGASVGGLAGVNGDAFGMRLRGSSIEGWYRSSGESWAWKLSRSDATYAAAGYLGFFSGSEGTWRMGPFGGGTVAGAGRLVDSLRLKSKVQGGLA